MPDFCKIYVTLISFVKSLQIVPLIYLATVFAGLFLRLNLETHYKFCRYFHIHVVKQKAGLISSICPVSSSNPESEAFSGQNQSQMFFLTNLKLYRIFSGLLCSPFLGDFVSFKLQSFTQAYLKSPKFSQLLTSSFTFNHH